MRRFFVLVIMLLCVFSIFGCANIANTIDIYDGIQQRCQDKDLLDDSSLPSCSINNSVSVCSCCNSINCLIN